jgi:hypothetical protein
LAPALKPVPSKTPNMKNFLVFTLLLAFPVITYCQTPSINKFYRQYKGSDDAVSFVVPGLLIRAGAHFAPWLMNETDTEIRNLVRMGKKIKKTRILVVEDYNPVAPEDYKKLERKVRKSNYEELLYVRAEGENVSIFVRDKKNKLKNLLILVSSEDTFVMLSMKTKLKYDQLFEAINDMINLDEESEEPTIDLIRA